MVKSFFLIIYFFFSVSGFSQNENDNYHYIGKDFNDIEYYVLIEKINSESNKSIWIKKVFPVKTIKNKKGKKINSGGGWELYFNEIDCSESEIIVREKNTFDSKGNLKKTSREYSSYKVIPGSMGDKIKKYVCEN